ncbi:MAG: nuclease [Gemmatimonadales bacterium]
MRQLTALALPTTDLGALRQRVKLLAEDRPAIYRMVDPAGRVLYVGKARRLRTRLLSYFRAQYPDDKGARILHAAHDILWNYVPSEFAAVLGEIREIRRHRPPFNFQGNRSRMPVFITVAAGPAPRLEARRRLPTGDERCYGPFGSAGRVQAGLRALNDLLGLRDCAAKMPMVFADQADLFSAPRQAACLRHDFGFCLGPCAGFTTGEEYHRRVMAAVEFLEGRSIRPVDRVVMEMGRAAEDQSFEEATRWREKFETLEWLLSATTRARSAVELLSFVYRDPGLHGDDRAYLIKRGTVRATFPYPTTPIELEGFRAVVREEMARPEPPAGLLPVAKLDEMLVVMSWFRRQPEAFRRTSKLEDWVTGGE